MSVVNIKEKSCVRSELSNLLRQPWPIDPSLEALTQCNTIFELASLAIYLSLAMVRGGGVNRYLVKARQM